MIPSIAPASAWSERLCDLVARASARARASGRRVLASVVEEVAPGDPLAALEAGSSGSDEPRMYWARPSEAGSFAALGAAVVIEPRGPGRFRESDAEWQQLMTDAVVDDPSGGAEGAGPILAGGFAFTTGRPRARHWTDFPDTGLWVPRVQLSAASGRHWLTATLVVEPDGVRDVDSTALHELRGALTGEPGAAGGPVMRRQDAAPAVRFRDEQAVAAWQALVASAVADIRSGPLTKVVLARARHALAAAPIDAFQLLRHLRDHHPGCLVFGCWRGTSAFLGASPERLVRLAGRQVQASSLAGSAPRGSTPAEDSKLATELATSAKDRAEHALVREALVDALGRLCDHVEADDVPSLLTLEHVHHLHTAVGATLHEGRTLIDLVEALHPTPAVGGAPRQAALEYIREHEPIDRGWYAAPVGWVGRHGGEFAVALRSAVVRGSEAWLHAGCGIVAGSTPAEEYSETLLKLRPMEEALTAAGAGHA